MRVIFKFFLQSFQTTLMRPAAWIISLVFIILDTIFVLIVPMVIQLDDKWMAPFITQFFWLFTLGMFSSFLGELISNPEDRLFVLTRPVRRFTYLTAKLFLAIISCCALAAINSIYIFFVNKHFAASPQHVGFPTVSASRQALTAFMFAIFGASVGCGFRYYTKPMIPTVITMAFALSYSVTFAFLGGTPSRSVAHMQNLEFFIFPLSLILPLNFIVIITGYILNSKTNIGV